LGGGGVFSQKTIIWHLRSLSHTRTVAALLYTKKGQILHIPKKNVSKRPLITKKGLSGGGIRQEKDRDKQKPKT